MKLPGIARKSLLLVIALVAPGATGTLFFLTNSNSIPTEAIESLLDLRGKCFIEIVRYKGEEAYDDYWHHDGKFQELVARLQNYNRFIVKSEFKKSNPGHNEPSHEPYYRLLIGPFGNWTAQSELTRLREGGYKDISVQTIPEDDESIPTDAHRLLLLYTAGDGPKFISGWLHLWFAFIEYGISEKSNKLLFHSLNTFHSYRNGGRLFIVDCENGDVGFIDEFESQGFVILPGSGTAIVQRSFYIPPDKSTLGTDYGIGYELDKNELEKAAKAIGIASSRLEVKYLGDRPSAKVSALFELDLESKRLRSLGIFGGLGGLFMTGDGGLYSSSSDFIIYGGQRINENPLLLFGKPPYYRVDLKKKQRLKMPESFTPPHNAIIQPEIAEWTDEFTTIVESGVVKLISFKGIFYLQH